MASWFPKQHFYLSLFLILIVLMITLVCLWGQGTIGSNHSNSDISNVVTEEQKILDDDDNRQDISQSVERIERVDKTTTLQEGEFYPMSPTCQILGLSQIYTDVFGDKTDGVFVEFGAFDGQSFSNTCGLADLGWRGIYIEPVPQWQAKCRERHEDNKNVVIVDCAVGPENGNITLNLGGALSTASKDFAKIYNHTEWSQHLHVGEKSIQVQQKLLHDILMEHKVEPKFDLLVVDIEGFEWQALQNFDIELWSPKMVIIEIEDEHDSFQDRSDIVGHQAWHDIRQRFQNLREYFQNAGYSIYYKDHINTVYVLE